MKYWFKVFLTQNKHGFQYPCKKILFSENLAPEFFLMIEDSVIANLGIFFGPYYEIFIGWPLREKKK